MERWDRREPANGEGAEGSVDHANGGWRHVCGSVLRQLFHQGTMHPLH